MAKYDEPTKKKLKLVQELQECCYYNYNSEEEEEKEKEKAAVNARRYRIPDLDEDPETWVKYLQQIDESEAFDIFDFPVGPDPSVIRIFPMNIDKNMEGYDHLLEKAKAAIDYLNKKQMAMWKLVKIESANSQGWDAGMNCYITFQAKPEDADDTHDSITTFQALVWKGIPSNSPARVLIVQFCRVKEAAT